jgi:hypothetical protein
MVPIDALRAGFGMMMICVGGLWIAVWPTGYRSRPRVAHIAELPKLPA